MAECSKKNFSKNFIMLLISKYTEYNYHFHIISWDVQKCGRDIFGYQGEYSKLKVVYRKNDDNEDKYLHFFIKSLPYEEQKAKKLLEVGYFKREFGVYTRILTKFDKIQKEPMYHAKIAPSSSIELIMEDLQMSGYLVRSARHQFDREHCQVAIQSLAKLHAGTLIYEEIMIANRYPIKIEQKYKDLLQECGYVYNSWFVAGCEASLAVANAHPSSFYHKTEPNKMNDYRTAFKSALEMCRPSNTHRNVLCHRDLWSNNLMFSYDEKNKPVHCKFVDFQAAICMPPAGDLVSLLYLNLDRQARRYIYDDMILYYYECLKAELFQFNLDIDDVYMPFRDHKWLCRKYVIWGLVQGILLQPFALLQDEDIKFVLHKDNYDFLLNSQRSHFILNVTKKDPFYKQRLSEYIEEFIEIYCP